MIKRVKFLIVISGLFLTTSCTTYLIPIHSFKQQFADLDSTNFKEVKVCGPFGETHYYLANPIGVINCVDKDGNNAELINSPSIEIRFTYGKNNKRTVFYFDRVYVSDSSVVGVQSRLISAIRKTIPLNDISKIEIQDGKKKYFYVK